MATEIIAAPLGELRAGSTTGGGRALTTAATTIPLLPGTRFIQLIPRKYAGGCEVIKIATCPYLLVLKTTDALGSAPTDYSSEAQDLSASTVVDLSSLNTGGNGDYLYVGATLPFRGVKVNVTNVNGNASELTVKYWNGSAWTDISDADGTITGGDTTFGEDGNVTWTVPAIGTWVADSLVDIGDALSAVGPYVGQEDIYWTRWEVSAALDSSVTLQEFHALSRESTQYWELISEIPLEMVVNNHLGGVGAIEALTDAGTASLIVNCASRSPTSRFV
jgi:hypothetical protein